MAPEMTTLSGRYVLEVPVASGAMASVWRARDDVLARTVAVKLLHERLAADEDFIARFRREALAAARLIHPHIVQIYDTGTEEGEGPDRHFIVMEYCGGGTLADLMKGEGPIEPDRGSSIGVTICDALGHAHKASIVHRDVKPANVLLSDHGTLKVADFGIAKAAYGTGDITTTGSILGTVRYISPEQAEGGEPDARSDLYGLGVVLYELLTGRPPFAAPTEVALALKHVNEDAPPLRAIRAGIPRSLDAAVLKALEKDPDRRYASADEMAEALRSATSGGVTAPFALPPDALRTSAQPPVSRDQEDDERDTFIATEGRKIAPVVVLVLVAIVVAVLVARGASDDPTLPDLSQGSGRSGGGAATLLEVSDAQDFDPHGGDGEHPELVDLAIDGNASTEWHSSDYSDALSLIKPGVGLLFDLGSDASVERVEIDMNDVGYALEVRAGSELGSDETSLDVIAEETTSDPLVEIAADGTTARYWLVWITGFPGGGGGRAGIKEVRFFGS